MGGADVRIAGSSGWPIGRMPFLDRAAVWPALQVAGLNPRNKVPPLALEKASRSGWIGVRTWTQKLGFQQVLRNSAVTAARGSARWLLACNGWRPVPCRCRMPHTNTPARATLTMRSLTMRMPADSPASKPKAASPPAARSARGAALAGEAAGWLADLLVSACPCKAAATTERNCLRSTGLVK